LWAGFVLVLVGLLSYIPLFALFPITRDIPWVNFLFFLAGGFLLTVGLARAFRHPELYRGKILGPILTAVSLLGVTLFIYGLFFLAPMPASTTAPQTGEKAPDFTLVDQDGRRFALADLLSSPPIGTASAKASGALLIFYRGHW
jgi:hypothetical protein